MATNEELALGGKAVAGLLAEAMGEDITGRSGRCPDFRHIARVVLART